MNYAPLIFATAMTGVDVLSFSIIKKVFTKDLSIGFGLLSMLLYAFQPIILYFALSYESVAVMNVLWNIISSIVVAIVGILFLNETIGTRKRIGIVFAIIAVYLFTFEDGVSEVQTYLTNLFK